MSSKKSTSKEYICCNRDMQTIIIISDESGTVSTLQCERCGKKKKKTTK